MPSVRPGFYTTQHYFTVQELLSLAQLEEGYKLFHAASVGNNLSTWFHKDDVIKPVDYYGADLTKAHGIDESYRVFHAVVDPAGGVYVYFADVMNQVDTPVEELEND